MAIELFILGLPGSGKSTAARHIVDNCEDWSTVRINDYDILYEMSRADKEGKRFSLTTYDGYDGFDVLDHSAFDDALWKLKAIAVKKKRKRSFAKPELIIIEFARDDYSKSLKKFFPDFLEDTKNAFFLFIDTDIPTCKQRIQDRVSKSPEKLIKEDDRYVSPFIFETYYQADNRQYFASVASQLEEEFGIPESHIGVIEDSNLTLNEFENQVETFVGQILQPERGVQPKLVRQFARSQLYKRSHIRIPLLDYILL